MVISSKQYQELQYHYEVLRARLEIREQFLNSIVRDVYENVGQVLSLVRMQLSMANQAPGDKQREILENSGKLVEQAVRDLRDMCRSFFPDREFFNDGQLHAIDKGLSILQPGSQGESPFIVGDHQSIREDMLLLVFQILLELIQTILAKGYSITGKEINYTAKNIRFIINYSGEKLTFRKESKLSGDVAKLTIAEKTKLLGGRLKVTNSKGSITKVEITIPLKTDV